VKVPPVSIPTKVTAGSGQDEDQANNRAARVSPAGAVIALVRR